MVKNGILQELFEGKFQNASFAKFLVDFIKEKWEYCNMYYELTETSWFMSWNGFSFPVHALCLSQVFPDQPQIGQLTSVY